MKGDYIFRAVTEFDLLPNFFKTKRNSWFMELMKAKLTSKCLKEVYYAIV